MDDIGFGRIERLVIRRGELVLDPWPTSVRDVRLGSEPAIQKNQCANDFELKRPVVELFEYVRSVVEGEIVCLELRRGNPVSMEIAYRPEAPPGGKTA